MNPLQRKYNHNRFCVRRQKTNLVILKETAVTLLFGSSVKYILKLLCEAGDTEKFRVHVHRAAIAILFLCLL